MNRMQSLPKTFSGTCLVAALTLLVLAVGSPSLAFGQEDGASGQEDGKVEKRIKVMVKKQHKIDCQGDDCDTNHFVIHGNSVLHEDGLPHEAEDHSGNTFVFRTHGDGASDDSKRVVRKVFVGENGETQVVEGGDHVWVTGVGNQLHGGGFLGVQMTELTDALRDHFGVPAGTGVLVSEVVAGSPAEKAGIRAGDIITAVDGGSISGASELSRKVRAFEEGENAAFEIVRDRQAQTLNATISERETKLARVKMITDDGHEMHFGDKNMRFEFCDDSEGDCDVDAMLAKIRVHHDNAKVLTIDKMDLGSLDCGGSDNCEINVTCENGDCVCTVDGEEVPCNG